MRATACLVAVAIGFAAAAHAEDLPFWPAVQATCTATAATPSGALGQRIAQAARTEFDAFGGHRIDAGGRLIHFGLTEAESRREDRANGREARLDSLGWWRVLAYWRALYGVAAGGLGNELEVRGYRGAADSQDAAQIAERLRVDIGPLLKAADGIADPAQREAMREAIIRAAIVDTPWSAAFISYVMRQAGATATGFAFSNAHRVYIDDAFATSAAEVAHKTDARIYRACPLATTRPRVGDMICLEREPSLAKLSAAAVRERIRQEVAAGARTLQRTHCEVVARIDAPARKIYTIGGNVLNAVTARKMNLTRDMKLSPVQSGRCGGAGAWTLAEPGAAPENCALNDQKWFVLLQLR